MKKFIAISFILILSISHMFALADIYPKTFIIEEINYSAGTIVFEDYNQNLWEWISDSEDLEVGDIVSALMSDNNTKTIFDDQIIEVRYAGTIEGWR